VIDGLHPVIGSSKPTAADHPSKATRPPIDFSSRTKFDFAGHTLQQE
jgi:hypothetical protein